jgi:hypothetical protein
MTLRFIYFKTSEPQNTEPQPATSLAESNFEWCFRSRSAHVAQAPDAAGALAPRVAQSFFKLTEYIIRWTFNVQCSMFDVQFLVNPLYETSSGYNSEPQNFEVWFRFAQSI